MNRGYKEKVIPLSAQAEEIIHYILTSYNRHIEDIISYLILVKV